MRRSTTSPYYSRWTEIAAVDFDGARAAVAARDFARLAGIAENNCLAMHAVMLSARPSLLYWNGATVDCMACISALRAAGEPVFFTIDAGPQVKAVCEPGAAPRVRAALAQVPGVEEVLVVGLGEAARLTVVTIVASAPGKLVVSGEYAVLVGAPALVLAVDRRVTCSLSDAATGGWRFTSNGYAPDARHPLATLLGETPLPRTDPAYLCQHVLRRLLTAGIALDTLPTALTIDIDSRAGFDAGHKLGLGTSAAVCATLSGALLARCGSKLATCSRSRSMHTARRRAAAAAASTSRRRATVA